MSGIGEFIRRRRKQIEINGKTMTQKDLAEALARRGYSYATSTIGWWENNLSNPPIHDTGFMNTLADSLDVSLNKLVEAIGIHDPERQIRVDDITPIEHDLLIAYRNGDFQEVMRITLQKADTEG